MPAPNHRGMAPEEARQLKNRWGFAGPAPNPAWIWCAWCGEPWPDDPAYWTANVRSGRICRACRKDYQRGHGKPHSDQWHKKNRWTKDGGLLRKCARCGQWKPIEQFHATRKRNEQLQAHVICAHCMNHPPARYLARRKRNNWYRRKNGNGNGH